MLDEQTQHGVTRATVAFGENNSAGQYGQYAAIRAGLARDDLFCVVHDQFITDTARYADIVLPATTQLEADDVVIAWGHLWMGWNEAAIAPVGESVSNTELFRRLAAAMGYDEPSLFDDDDTLIRQALPDVDLDALRRNDWWKVPYPDTPTPFSDAVFNHQARLTVTARVSDRLGVGTAMMPWGWWCNQHGDGGVANDLTSDASTDWGPGTAFFDTRVDVASVHTEVTTPGG